MIMKKLTLMLTVALGMYFVNPTAVVANENETATQEATKTNDGKTEVKAEELPAVVLADLKASNADANVAKAFVVADAAGAVAGYEVILSTGTTVAYDAAGKRK
jgi:hypothetical protein